MKPFRKVIIAGSRSFKDYALLSKIMQELYFIPDIEVVCGEANGADLLGRMWAEECGIGIHSFPADWKTYGKYAGIERNQRMGEFADEAVVFWNGNSKGTQNMINIMKLLGKPVTVVTFGEQKGDER